ncbi:MAG: glpG, partial [Chlamydiia bacterium]|nr:glpG [Chlamydiia bacterium]
MRLIWSTEQIDSLRKFSRFLHKKGIDHMQEEVANRDWASTSYGNKIYNLWIQDENQVAETQTLLTAFLQDPDSTLYTLPQENALENISPVTTPQSPSKQFLEKRKQFKPASSSAQFPKKNRGPFQFYLTNFLIILCST